MDEFAPEGTSLSPGSFARFASFITGELGIKMPTSKMTLVQSRILRRVRELQLRSVEEYGDLFFSGDNSEEREQFINVITTNKTDFFREPTHFDYLVGDAIPELEVENHGLAGPLKVWSVGCSTGEEPYTLAMVLAEHAEHNGGPDFAILATDVSTKVLQHGKKGIYQHSQIAPIPIELRRKYLLRSKKSTDQLVRIVPRLRERIAFHWLNLMESDYMLQERFHVIFFRNVLIYFDRNTQEAVVRKLCRHLVPGGYLFIGHSESLNGLDVPLETVGTSVFRRK